MSDDIIERLREWIDGADERLDGAAMWDEGAPLMEDAIAEIERLRGPIWIVEAHWTADSIEESLVSCIYRDAVAAHAAADAIDRAPTKASGTVVRFDFVTGLFEQEHR